MDFARDLADWMAAYGTVLFVAGLVVLMIAEFLFPRFAMSPRERLVGIARNAVIWALCIVCLLAAATLAPFAHHLVAAYGVGLAPQLGMPLWLAAVIGFFAADLADYVFHRLSHQWRPLWLLHSVHHSDPQPGVMTNLRAHPLSVVAAFLFRLLVIVALGAPLWSLLLRDVIATTQAQLHHAGVAWPKWFVVWTERYLGKVLMVPTAHWVHHSPEQRYTDSNFGQVFSLWDHIFGTYVSMTEFPPVAGLDTMRERRWQTVWGMLATPWRARRQERF
ncbi:MAG: sterol desaturase family protein [Azoarcus sp.]|nr:sterol desaturase family protein [Azoarcus sp.]